MLRPAGQLAGPLAGSKRGSPRPLIRNMLPARTRRPYRRPRWQDPTARNARRPRPKGRACAGDRGVIQEWRPGAEGTAREGPSPTAKETTVGISACNLSKAARVAAPAPAGLCVRHSDTCAPISARPGIFDNFKEKPKPPQNGTRQSRSSKGTRSNVLFSTPSSTPVRTREYP